MNCEQPEPPSMLRRVVDKISGNPMRSTCAEDERDPRCTDTAGVSKDIPSKVSEATRHGALGRARSKIREAKATRMDPMSSKPLPAPFEKVIAEHAPKIRLLASGLSDAARAELVIDIRDSTSELLPIATFLETNLVIAEALRLEAPDDARSFVRSFGAPTPAGAIRLAVTVQGHGMRARSMTI